MNDLEGERGSRVVWRLVRIVNWALLPLPGVSNYKIIIFMVLQLAKGFLA